MLATSAESRKTVDIDRCDLFSFDFVGYSLIGRRLTDSTVKHGIKIKELRFQYRPSRAPSSGKQMKKRNIVNHNHKA